ncbi:MAG: sensor histidine kinase, partial [Bradymonadaceae bacterium]
GVVFPGVLYDPVTLSAGPMFWPAMAAAVVGATIPMYKIGRSFLQADSSRRRRLYGMLIGAGLLGYVGAWANAVLLSYGRPVPHGILMVLGGMLLLTQVVRVRQRDRDRRLFERSMLYAAIAAFLSAGFLFGVVTLLSESAEPLLTDYRLGALFLLFMAALAFEPLRQQLQSFLARHLATNSAAADELASELAEQEKRADQAERLAELGTFTSAIAHEVRNPLGVLQGCVRVLEREDVDPETIAEMNEQIERASDFLDELLAYGRPRSLELRDVSLADTVNLALSSATGALGEIAEQVDIERRGFEEAPTIEADQGQLTEVFVALLENALLELDVSEGNRLRITIARDDGDGVVQLEDDGRGIPDELTDSLFEPFVTGRKRDGAQTGTGLGLAIARRIVERHHGTIETTDSTLGGAGFLVQLPVDQTLLGAATAVN